MAWKMPGKYFSVGKDAVRMPALQQPDDVSRQQDQQQRNAQPEQDGLGEQEPEQIHERV
jgi:hypothetical protein